MVYAASIIRKIVVFQNPLKSIQDLGGSLCEFFLSFAKAIKKLLVQKKMYNLCLKSEVAS
jgi:hypothetical protein